MTRVYTSIKELSFAPEPVSLFGELSKDGQVANTLMLESADIVTRKGEKSIIVASAALKATCRNGEVMLESLSNNGAKALDGIRASLAQFVVDENEHHLRLRFEKPKRDQNLDDRLRSASSLDVLRVMTHGFVHDPGAPAGTFLVAGLFAYDLIDQIEDLPEAKQDVLHFPDYVFWLPEILIVIDHRRQKMHLVHHAFDESNLGVSKLEELAEYCTQLHARYQPKHETQALNIAPISANELSDVSDVEYGKVVEQVKERIVAGDVFQIVPSRTFKMPCTAPLTAYEALRRLNPSPYMYVVVDNEFALFGASPETFIKVSDKGKLVEVRPIAGTRRRGFGPDGRIDQDLDSRMEAELRLDKKELAEHFMLVDLARNDVARVAKPKTRFVDKLLTVDRYSHVMHLVSYVRGELREELDALHAYQASMNMGTIVGAPKVKAAQILREVEKTKRGFYGGAVGYFDREGNMDTAIVIRSALVKENMAYVRAGAGIVYDSIAEEEISETKSKAEAVLRAIAISAQQLSGARAES